MVALKECEERGKIVTLEVWVEKKIDVDRLLEDLKLIG